MTAGPARRMGVNHSCRCCGPCWEPSDRGEVGVVYRGLFNFGMHVGHGHALPGVNNPAPVESPSRWERSLLDGPGIIRCRSGA